MPVHYAGTRSLCKQTPGEWARNSQEDQLPSHSKWRGGGGGRQGKKIGQYPSASGGARTHDPWIMSPMHKPLHHQLGPTHIHTYVHTYIRTYIHTHTHIHTYIRTYMHTYTNIHTLNTLLRAKSACLSGVPVAFNKDSMILCTRTDSLVLRNITLALQELK